MGQREDKESKIPHDEGLQPQQDLRKSDENQHRQPHTEKERDGYVPNVVYTCGAMIHNGQLYIPFATSDTMTRFASVSLQKLLERLVK